MPAVSRQSGCAHVTLVQHQYRGTKDVPRCSHVFHIRLSQERLDFRLAPHWKKETDVHSVSKELAAHELHGSLKKKILPLNSSSQSPPLLLLCAAAGRCVPRVRGTHLWRSAYEPHDDWRQVCTEEEDPVTGRRGKEKEGKGEGLEKGRRKNKTAPSWENIINVYYIHVQTCRMKPTPRSVNVS